MGKPTLEIILVPTRVGMILILCAQDKEVETCPHTRGDDPKIFEEFTIFEDLSPHAWG